MELLAKKLIHGVCLLVFVLGTFNACRGQEPADSTKLESLFAVLREYAPLFQSGTIQYSNNLGRPDDREVTIIWQNGNFQVVTDCVVRNNGQRTVTSSNVSTLIANKLQVVLSASGLTPVESNYDDVCLKDPPIMLADFSTLKAVGFQAPEFSNLVDQGFGYRPLVLFDKDKTKMSLEIQDNFATISIDLDDDSEESYTFDLNNHCRLQRVCIRKDGTPIFTSESKEFRQVANSLLYFPSHVEIVRVYENGSTPLKMKIELQISTDPNGSRFEFKEVKNTLKSVQDGENKGDGGRFAK